MKPQANEIDNARAGSDPTTFDMTDDNPGAPATRQLSALLKQAADTLQALTPPPLPAAAGRALAKAARQPAPRPVARWPAWATTRLLRSPLPWAGVGSLAALLLVVAFDWWRPAAPALAAAPTWVQSDDNHFVPVVGPERWQRLQEQGASRAWVVPTEVPPQQLASWGLPFDPGRASVSVRAELLMQASGEVLAMRLLR